MTTLKKKKKSGVHFFVFANIMFSKCRIWLDVSWSLVVKWFIFREFLKIMTKAGIKIASYRSREREIAVQAKVAPPGRIMSFFPWTNLQFRKNVFLSHFGVGYQLKDFSIKCEGHMRGGIYKKKKKMIALKAAHLIFNDISSANLWTRKVTNCS